MLKVENMPVELYLGKQTESGVITLEIDISRWRYIVPGVAVVIFAKRPGEDSAYPVATTTDGDVIKWVVSGVDTALSGNGEMEIAGTLDGKKMLSSTVRTRIAETITDVTDAPPSAAEPYVNKVIEAGRNTPKIGAHGTWLVYNMDAGEYEDTGVPAVGKDGKDAVVDSTLTKEGQAADAKATGEEIGKLKDDIIDLTNSVGYTTYSASDNIFDKNDVTVGYTLNLYNGADISSVTERDGRFVYNKIISVSPGDLIRYSVSWSTIGLYRDDGTYLSKVNDANYSFVVPVGAKYMRFAQSTANLDTFMMTINKDLPSEYEPYRKEETVLQDLSNVPQQIEAIEKVLNISNKRIIIASDLHLHSADMMLTTYGGVTHSDRMQLFVDSINAENRKKHIDAVFINGDLSLGTSRDDCVYFAKHFLPQFDVPCYVFAGDHDVVTNDDWVSIFGRGRQFTVDIGGYSIIGLDGFWDVDPSTSGMTPQSVFDEIYATEQIENATSAGLVPIVLTHRDLYIWNAPSSFKSGAWKKVKVSFASHTHDTTKEDKIIKTGNFSYPPGANYDNFGDKGENRWGFRNVEFVGGKIITYMIYPKQTLSIPSINGGLPKTYDYTMDDDNAYGTNYVID